MDDEKLPPPPPYHVPPAGEPTPPPPEPPAPAVWPPPAPATAAGPPLAPAAPTREPLATLAWTPRQVYALIAFSLALNIGQALLLLALHIDKLPGEWPHVVRTAVAVVFYAVILSPVWIGARRQGLRFSEAVGFRRVRLGRAFGYAILAAIAMRWFALVWVLFTQAVHLTLPGQNVDITRVFGTSPVGLLATLAVAVFIGPIAEEIQLRGICYGRLREYYKEGTAVAISASLFALLHVNAYNFVPLVAIGVLLAFLFRYTRSLWTSVMAHGLFNLMTVIVIAALQTRPR